ncbi:MAG: formylglycine-generating enzyme family protein [Myxococcota bacterium]
MRLAELEALLQLTPANRLEPLIELARGILADPDTDPALRQQCVNELVTLISTDVGQPLSRMAAGEVLGALGDPRLRTPEDAGYWSTVEVDGHSIQVGCNLVTIAEIVSFFANDGYKKDEHWSEAGKKWRDTRRTFWTDLANEPDSTPLVIPNQPAIGVTWYEAQAYAHAHNARLLSLDERLQVMRGDANRPYPWGQPFGQGNANTNEATLGKPVAIGLFIADCTPDGIYDLAGNVAEWTSDEADEEVVIHPGSWNSPSMSSWAKARALVPAKTRSADLGFRIARDV